MINILKVTPNDQARLPEPCKAFRIGTRGLLVYADADGVVYRKTVPADSYVTINPPAVIVLEESTCRGIYACY